VLVRSKLEALCGGGIKRCKPLYQLTGLAAVGTQLSKFTARYDGRTRRRSTPGSPISTTYWQAGKLVAAAEPPISEDPVPLAPAPDELLPEDPLLAPRPDALPPDAPEPDMPAVVPDDPEPMLLELVPEPLELAAALSCTFPELSLQCVAAEMFPLVPAVAPPELLPLAPPELDCAAARPVVAPNTAAANRIVFIFMRYSLSSLPDSGPIRAVIVRSSVR
jgi:hypothetical protein